MNPHIINEVFAWAPLVAFGVVLTAVYFGKRSEPGVGAPRGKTYACAQCGRRGSREHMVPVSHEGAVVWYCGRCAQPQKNR
jgi:hypothetical protein